MFFEWDEDYDTGIPEIDLQHRRIVEYINLLDASIGSGGAHLHYVLEELTDYTINHFLFEERLLARSGYEFMRAHSKTHQIFSKRIAEYRGRFSNGEDVTEELLTMLKNWLARHIVEEDMAYVSCVKRVSNNVEERSWINEMRKLIFG